MNIFAISNDAKECAQALDDLRLNKMIIETAQLLSTAARFHGYQDPLIYKSTHINHPCSVWARKTSANYDWLHEYLIFLTEEKVYRTQKQHKTSMLIAPLSCAKSIIPAGDMTQFANCSLYKNDVDVFEAYKKTMREKWAADVRSPKWTLRGKPIWA